MVGCCIQEQDRDWLIGCRWVAGWQPAVKAPTTAGPYPALPYPMLHPPGCYTPPHSTVMNCVWSFARLGYSPDPDREMWASRSSRATATRLQYGTAADWAQTAATWAQTAATEAAAAASAADRRRHILSTNARDRAAEAHKQRVQTLAQRVAAQRQEREAFQRLLAYTREATAAALARSPIASAELEQEVEPAGQAVNERNMGDLVHFIQTGSPDRPRAPRVRMPAVGNQVRACSRLLGVLEKSACCSRCGGCPVVLLLTVPCMGLGAMLCRAVGQPGMPQPPSVPASYSACLPHPTRPPAYPLRPHPTDRAGGVH